MEDTDSEISSTLDTITLIDPVSLCRIKVPAKSSTCVHLQCFDLSLFLQLNLSLPQWKCGICDKPALYQDLIVDGFFDSILKFL